MFLLGLDAEPGVERVGHQDGQVAVLVGHHALSDAHCAVLGPLEREAGRPAAGALHRRGDVPVALLVAGAGRRVSLLVGHGLGGLQVSVPAGGAARLDGRRLGAAGGARGDQGSRVAPVPLSRHNAARRIRLTAAAETTRRGTTTDQQQWQPIENKLCLPPNEVMESITKRTL